MQFLYSDFFFTGKYNQIFLSQITVSQVGSSSLSVDHLPSPLHPLHVHVAARHGDDDTDDRGAVLSTSCLRDNFHYPHHCAVPNCDFMVSWREEGEAVTFNLTTKVEDTSMVWAALGFSEDTNMVQSVISQSLLQSYALMPF